MTMTPEQEAILKEIIAKRAPAASLPEVPTAAPAKEITVGMPLEEASAIARGNLAQFAKNVPASGAKFLSDVTYPIRHPINTAQGLKRLYDDPEARQAVLDFYGDRWGSWDKASNTMYTDPIGGLSDLALPFTGVGLGAKALQVGGKLGKLGQVAGTVGRVIDPVTASVNVAKNVGKGAGVVGSEVVGHLLTGTGGKPIRVAAETGFNASKNPEAAAAFTSQMRDPKAAPIVQSAKTGVTALEKNRGAQYKVDKLEMRAGGQSPIDLNPVIKSLDDSEFGKFDPGGGLPKEDLLSGHAQAVRDQIKAEVVDWSKKGTTTADAMRYHSAEGLDALKRKIGNIRNSQPFGSTERAIANHAYGEVWKQIEKSYPKYAKMMEHYKEASDVIEEVQKSLSLGAKEKDVSKQIGRLMSIFQNSAKAGRKLDLVQLLDDAGAKNLMPMLAGTAMSSWAPHGLAKVGGIMNVVGHGGLHGLWALADPSLLLSAPLQMPRVVGEGAHLGGKAARPLSKIPAKPALRGLNQLKSTREE